MAGTDEYARLFDARGNRYHAAMEHFPHARDAEFTTALDIAGVRPGDVVADIPCGGGYLAPYLPADVTLWSVDSSDGFARFARRAGQDHFLQCPITAVPLADGLLDHVISIAGLHHVDDRGPFWRECARLLRPGGTLTVCDVRAGSPVARFLDSVVDRHTPTGHRGQYFDEGTIAEMNAAGLRVTRCEPRRIPWRATDRTALATFCCLLFGLEGITPAELAPVLAATVGVRDEPAGVALDWELQCYRATRAADDHSSGD